MTIILSAKARADLSVMVEQGSGRWGEAAAEAYARSLLSDVQILSEMPDLGRPRPEIGDTVRSLVSGRHFVLYRVEAETIYILAFPHQSSNPTSYL